jgi:polar amino acid transport system substrate-binding protein
MFGIIRTAAEPGRRRAPRRLLAGLVALGLLITSCSSGTSGGSSSPAAGGAAGSSTSPAPASTSGSATGGSASAGAATGGSAAGQSSTGTSAAAGAGGSSTAASGSAGQSLHDQLPDAIKQRGTLVLGTTAQYPPCESFAPGSTEMVGFEPDIWNAIGQKLGVKIDATSLDFSSLLPGVQSGKFDVAIECIRDTAAREATVSFVDFIYGAVGFLILATNAKHISSDPLSVCGLKAAIVTGSANEDRMKQLSDNCTAKGKAAIDVTKFPAQANVLLALKSGRADFTMQDYASAKYISQTSDVDVTVVSQDFIPKGYLGMVVAKDNVQLQNALLAAMKAVIADGTYAQILKQWSVSDLALNDPGINLAASRPIG